MPKKKFLEFDWWTSFTVSKKYNKYGEIQSWNNYAGATNPFDIKLSWTMKCDHAGFDFYIEIWSFMFNFKIYDNRHWDYDNDQWEVYDKK